MHLTLHWELSGPHLIASALVDIYILIELPHFWLVLNHILLYYWLLCTYCIVSVSGVDCVVVVESHHGLWLLIDWLLVHGLVCTIRVRIYVRVVLLDRIDIILELRLLGLTAIL